MDEKGAITIRGNSDCRKGRAKHNKQPCRCLAIRMLWNEKIERSASCDKVGDERAAGKDGEQNSTRSGHMSPERRTHLLVRVDIGELVDRLHHVLVPLRLQQQSSTTSDWA
eukprot:1089703-Pleurochrysis_carterae.AAC.1